MRTASLIMCILVAAILGCKDEGKAPKATEPFEIKLRQEWIPNANYAGAVLAATTFAPQHGVRITIQPGSEDLDPLKLLMLGEATVADVGADKVLLAKSQGADLVVVGVLNRNSPVSFPTR